MTRSSTQLALLAAAACALAGAGGLAAQNPAPPTSESVDRIVAVVGDSIVTELNLEEDIVRLQAMNQIPKNPAPDQLATIRRQLLDTRVDDLILLQTALKDTTLKVAPEQVNAQVQQQMTAIQQNYPTPTAFQQALAAQGLTEAEYRQQLENDVHRTMLIQSYMAKVQRDRKPPVPTEDQIRKYFDEQKDQLGERPATITFEQIVVAPQPTDSARQAARAEADSILVKLRAGEDFAALAKHYSQDPGTRDKGGELGWFRRGQMVQAFEDVAFALRPGEISSVVESPFGFHIIQLEKVRGAEREARHILIKPDITAADTARAHQRAEEVAAKLKAGTVSFDTLVAQYNDSTQQQTKVGPWPKDKLPPPYDTELGDAQPGQVVVFPLTGDTSTKWAVVKVQEVKAAGAYSLDDPELREQIRHQVERQLLMNELIRELKRNMYVDIRLQS